MRLFVAIELDEGVRSALSELQKKFDQACRGVRWIPAHQLHLTAKFLGEVPDDKVSEVAAALERAAARAAAHEFDVADCGCFPRGGPVRIVWAGVREPSGKLAECVDAVEAEMERVGYARERRPFSPHITIGRVREDRSRGGIRSAAGATTLAAMAQPVEVLTLMQSVLSPKGPTYTPVTKIELGKA